MKDKIILGNNYTGYKLVHGYKCDCGCRCKEREFNVLFFFFSPRINRREIDLVFFSGKVIIYRVEDKTETRLKVVHGLAYCTSQIKLSVLLVLFISAILI